MKTKILWCCVLSLISFTTFGRTGQPVTLQTKTGNISGTLLMPKMQKPVPVVLLIAGSGPTDRNGNNSIMKPNTLKMLADSLYAHDIASLRYDKRGIGKSKSAASAEVNLRFSNYIQVGMEDATNLEKSDPKAQLAVISGMNHILKNAPKDRTENIQTYFKPDLPLNKQLVKVVVNFIKGTK